MIERLFSLMKAGAFFAPKNAHLKEIVKKVSFYAQLLKGAHRAKRRRKSPRKAVFHRAFE